MKKTGLILVIVGLLVMLALPGCGSTPQASTSTIASDGVVVSLIAKPMTVKKDLETLLTLTVRNTSSSAKSYSLPSSMEFDFAAFRKYSGEVWRYSSGKAFTQSITTKAIAPGVTLTYRAGWTPTAPGQYTVQGYFTGLPDARPEVQVNVGP
jgi:Intracellular proteinase inhibitor